LYVVAGTVEVKGEAYWDWDHQVDLEAFNSQTLYDVLACQSRGVTRDLGKQKEEVGTALSCALWLGWSCAIWVSQIILIYFPEHFLSAHA
jgi:hypothetical protein